MIGREMRIPSFEVRSQRSVKLAQCADVPSLMIIAGPNGTGKSTLLNDLRTQQGSGGIIYVAPHRSTRRQQVQQQYLFGPPIHFEELLSQSNTPAMDGVQLMGGKRDTWGYDDTVNYLKHALCQIEVEREHAIVARIDRNGQLLSNELIDPWQPLKELTNNLLPHMSFYKIDASDRRKVQCLWKVHNSEEPVDFDDLSSGEKSIIQMFYPVIEHEINSLLRQIESNIQIENRPEICVLIDEPELHLHPNLQIKVLDYFRQLTTRGKTQVILATHSPTIVEYATFEELFLLRPIELVNPNENQLVQVASDEERLKLLREIFGTTANLTAMQPIVIVESVTEKAATKRVPDRKLYRQLHPGFDRVTVIAGGSKNECKQLLKVLNEQLADFSIYLKATALLDRDTELKSSDEGINLLPVGMIENFLIDPQCIWEAIQSVVDKTSFRSSSDVEQALDNLLEELETEEISRRAIAKFDALHFRLRKPLDQFSEQVTEFVQQIQNTYNKESITQALQEAQDEVTTLRVQQKRREEFHGKTILAEFYSRYLHSTGLAKPIFIYYICKSARNRSSVSRYFNEFFDNLLS